MRIVQLIKSIHNAPHMRLSQLYIYIKKILKCVVYIQVENALSLLIGGVTNMYIPAYGSFFESVMIVSDNYYVTFCYGQSFQEISRQETVKLTTVTSTFFFLFSKSSQTIYNFWQNSIRNFMYFIIRGTLKEYTYVKNTYQKYEYIQKKKKKHGT